MSFRLDIADSGELLKRFGMDGVLRRGKGSEVWGWGTAYGKPVQASPATPVGVKK